MPELLSTRYEDLVFLLIRYGAIWFYVFLFVSATFENLFPPYPGDTVTFIGSLFAISGSLDMVFVFLAVCGGGLIGCLILYFFGRTKGRKAFMHNRGGFLNRIQLEKIESWFAKYGDWVIVVSRFLTGVRSGVALAAGVGNVRPLFMVAYSLISIVLWNLLIILSASLIHSNWEKLYQLTKIYNWVVLIIFGLGILVSIAIFKRKNR